MPNERLLPSGNYPCFSVWRGRLYPEDCAQIDLKIGDLAAPT